MAYTLSAIPQYPGRGYPARCLRALRAALLGVSALLLLLACTTPELPRGELKNIPDDAYRIFNPSRLYARATGVGCGGNIKEALTSARRVAQFNLRTVSGPARYLVSYRNLDEFPRDNLICAEVEASAYLP